MQVGVPGGQVQSSSFGQSGFRQAFVPILETVEQTSWTGSFEQSRVVLQVPLQAIGVRVTVLETWATHLATGMDHWPLPIENLALICTLVTCFPDQFLSITKRFAYGRVLEPVVRIAVPGSLKIRT